jgi:hypothetical protein
MAEQASVHEELVKTWHRAQALEGRANVVLEAFSGMQQGASALEYRTVIARAELELRALAYEALALAEALGRLDVAVDQALG